MSQSPRLSVPQPRKGAGEDDQSGALLWVGVGCEMAQASQWCTVLRTSGQHHAVKGDQVGSSGSGTNAEKHTRPSRPWRPTCLNLS